MSSIDALPPLREILDRHSLQADKRLGQNFLLDLQLTDRIARAAGDLSGVTVIEIGPGPGGLTRSLLRQGARKVIAIEQDARFYPVLDEIAGAAEGRLEYIAGDALAVNLAELVPGKKKIVANLPYNIATVLLFQWLEQITEFENLTLMFQKEVADRITAKPSTKDYGRLSVMVQWLCTAYALFDVSPKAFVPPPKVTSTIVQITPRAAPLVAVPQAELEKLVRIAFQQRRKMLRASLRNWVEDPIPALSKAGIPPTARPETLTVEDFCRLVQAYS